MLCPNCQGFDVGDPPWEDWYACPNCDVHPATAVYIRKLEARIEVLESAVAAHAGPPDPCPICARVMRPED